MHRRLEWSEKPPDMLLKGRATVLIDGQWGSTGKGKLAGFIANRACVDVAVCDFGPNAGHTYRDDGRKVVLKHLPTAAICPDTYICIDAGAVIVPTRLIEEVENLNAHDRIMIHPRAAVVSDEDIKVEKDLGRISSTQQGTGSALARKIMRKARLAEDVPSLRTWVGRTDFFVQHALRNGQQVLVETAQGYDLSLNYGWRYPYVTSRDITVASALSNAGIHPRDLGIIVGSLRTFPIRVGNVGSPMPGGISMPMPTSTDLPCVAGWGWSGPCHPDQAELTWEELSRRIGKFIEPERTTVTNKVRRIFTWSWVQYESFIMACRPDYLFINFANYLDKTAASPEGVMKSAPVADFLQSVFKRARGCGYPVKALLVGFGPLDDEMLTCREVV